VRRRVLTRERRAGSSAQLPSAACSPYVSHTMPTLYATHARVTWRDWVRFATGLGGGGGHGRCGSGPAGRISVDSDRTGPVRPRGLHRDRGDLAAFQILARPARRERQDRGVRSAHRTTGVDRPVAAARWFALLQRDRGPYLA